MSEPPKVVPTREEDAVPVEPSIAGDRIDQLVYEGLRNAVIEHATAGRSVPVSRNGKVVWLTPEELLQGESHSSGSCC
ncbi:hypothetical protein GKIL_1746 [Gloeobacter kilaueensis JS1]|uniref:Uncharacterized protein n=1 Tax=Gloeobacter kilaueensis (strain ATCC BAA-2537 / CCAP 1431/1 / ULC 316 / JS1) TaxID=1183438 RepID=U5QG98_GLOK1|nr:hypothetical protein GKIL_1746 [Gloeobacter kilaueensis JS1]